MTGGPSAEAFAALVTFLQGGLTGLVADLEHSLKGADAAHAAEAAQAAGVDPALLSAALLVRRDLGRLNDVIHATAIALALPRLLEPGETLVNRPSLAAGNDPSRNYDVETDRRVAEFKLAVWSGTDAMRKRTVFHDLVHLAADESGRRPELYVVGAGPMRFLRQSVSTAAWALNRGSETTRRLFEQRFGPVSTRIADFTAGPARHVRLVDLTGILPEVATALQPATGTPAPPEPGAELR